MHFSTLSGAGVALEISRALLGINKGTCSFSVCCILRMLWSLKETQYCVKLGIQYLKQGVCKPIQMLAKIRSSMDDMFDCLPESYLNLM